MSYRRPLSLMFALALTGSFTVSAALPRMAGAQVFQRLKDAAKKKAEEEAAKRAAESAGKAAGVSPVQQPAATESSSSANASASATTSSSGGRQKEWANYDFVPGNNVLFFTDFTEDQVGNFPKKLQFKSGAMEIVQLEGGQRALKASSSSRLLIPLPVTLPDKFTIELGVINRNSKGVGASTFDLAGGRVLNDGKYTQVGWGHNGMLVSGGELESAMSTPGDDQYMGKPAMFRVLADGAALKFYVDSKRLANIPNGKFLRDKVLLVELQGRDDANNAVYVTSIRVAQSQKSIYDELSGKGRWATQGILFDVAAADVKGESTPTLKEIADVLKQHPDLKIEIQGHTDNAGTAAANLKLSEERANAVVAALTTEYGVSPEQVTAKGYGSTKPVGTNATVEGRANNRRVELVKK